MVDLARAMRPATLLAVQTDAIRAAVDALTRSHRNVIERDDGAHDEIVVPSLWRQSTIALVTGSESAHGHGGSLSERSPLDVTLMELRVIVTRYTRRELILRSLRPSASTPRAVRQLAAHVMTHEPESLWWHAYRFESWVRMFGGYLHAYVHQATAVRLRNAPCPSCGTRQIVIDTDEGDRVVPPLLVNFVGEYVRAAQCGQCGAIWWRGVELEQLAALLA